MCISPVMLADGLLVSCRICWQCRTNRVNDWVGRNIAETKNSTVSYAVTFTYGRSWDGRADHLRSVLLTYPDIQRMLKRMRRRGMKVRYIIAGEYGAELQRAHWHGVFHFYGDILPDWEGEHLEWTQEQWDRVGGIHIPEWVYADEDNRPMGHVHIKKAVYAHVRYALKYLLKDTTDKSQSVLAMSKKPPLGWPYLRDLARETVEHGLVPPDLRYRFQVRTASGEEKRMEFLMTGKLAEMYLQEVISHWERCFPGKPRPASEAVDTYEEFGRLGSEENLTRTRVDELPEETSHFYSDGTAKIDVLREQRGIEYEPITKEAKQRALRGAHWDANRIMNKSDWLQTWLVENGERFTEEQQHEFVRQWWREGYRLLVEHTGISEAEFLNLTEAEQSYLVNNPFRLSVIRARRAARDAAAARAARGLLR